MATADRGVTARQGIPSSSGPDSAERAPRPLRRSDSSPPWEARFADLTDIERVRRSVGPHFGRALYWIPGVVLVPVAKPDELEEAVSELRESLGDVGLATGILLWFPSHQRPPSLTREQRAFGRIRVQAADARAVNLHSGGREGDLVEAVARSVLKDLGGESAAWLRGREKQLSAAVPSRR